MLHEAYKLYESRGQDRSTSATYYRRNRAVRLAGDSAGQDGSTNNSTVSLVGHGTATRVTLIDSLSLAFEGQGWSRPVMVQGEGFEPPKAEPDDLQSPVFDRFTIPA